MEGQSEIARIQAQVALEYDACQRIFNEPAITARHQFIKQRQANLGDCLEELVKHMRGKKPYRYLFVL